MSDTKHSPTPWQGWYGDFGNLLAIIDSENVSVFIPHILVGGGSGELQACLSSEADELNDIESWKSDIAFTLRACNHHDELVAACEEARALIQKSHRRPMAMPQPMYDALNNLDDILAKIKDA